MSRRLVAGLVALIAIGGVFAYGLSKQDDVSSIDTSHVTVPPVGLQDRSRPPTIKGTTLDGEAVLAGAPRGQAGLHQLLGLVVRALQEARRPTSAASRTGSAVGRRSSAWRSTRRVGRCRSFIRKAGWRYPIVSTALLRPRQPLRRDLLPDDDRRRRQRAGRRPPGRPADRRAAATPSCARSAPSTCRSSPRSPSRRSGSAPPSPPA